MKQKDMLTDAQVEMEIERLSKSDDVRLAKEEMRVKYRRRQYLYKLRCLEKRGKELKSDGVTMESLKKLDNSIPVESEREDG